MAFEIPLSKGFIAIVDDEDSDLSSMCWHAAPCGRTVYAVHSIDPKTKLMLHRAVWLRANPGRQLPPSVDHINGDGLDCRRANLREAEHRQNMKNLRLKKNNRSGFMGVCWNSSSKRWVATVFADGKSHYLGLFDDPAEAARVRDAEARRLFGEFASLNFPEGV